MMIMKKEKKKIFQSVLLFSEIRPEDEQIYIFRERNRGNNKIDDEEDCTIQEERKFQNESSR